MQNGPPPRTRTFSALVLASLLRQTVFIQGFRLLLCLFVYAVELGSFWPYIRRCHARMPPNAAQAPIQFLILADPHIITTSPHPSFPGALAWIVYPLRKTFGDRYLARAWRALQAAGTDIGGWTAKVWLGDLTDTGRLYYHGQGGPALIRRFFSIFPDDRSPTWNRTFYIPGDHDTAIKPHNTWHDVPGVDAYYKQQTREFTRWKFLNTFGTSVWNMGWDASPVYPPSSLPYLSSEPPLTQKSTYDTRRDETTRKTFNARVPINVAHADGSAPTRVAELILLDATDLVSMQRMGWNPWTEPPEGKPGAEADWRYGPTWWFVDSLSKDADRSIPRILFTHIPLHRGIAATTRETCELPPIATFPPGVEPVPHPTLSRLSPRPIKSGSDAEGTSENLLAPDWSQWLRERIQPSVIISGDDHDLCHHLHEGNSKVWSIPELTVPALSLTLGVQRAGYARLSIWQELPSSGVSAASADSPYGQAAGVGRDLAALPETKVAYTPCELPYHLHAWEMLYPLVLLFTCLVLRLRRLLLRRRGRGSRGVHRRSASASSSTSSIPLTAWSTSDRPAGKARDEEELLPPAYEQSQAKSNGDDVDEPDAPLRGGGSSSGSRRRSRSWSRSRSGSGSGSGSGSHSPTHSKSRLGAMWTRTGIPQSGFARDLCTVLWVPAVYWLLLMLLGY